MKASELIQKLQQTVDQHGDLTITLWDGEWSPIYFVGCGDVTVRPADQKNRDFGERFFVIEQEALI